MGLPRSNRGWLSIFGSLLVLVSYTTAAASDCDKRCLSDAATSYLEALTNNKTSRLSLAPELRVTSNGQEVELGAGIVWGPAVTVVNRDSFFDSATGIAIVFATIAGQPQPNRRWWHYALRLKVDAKGRIVEVEEHATESGFQSASRVEVPFKESDLFDAILPEDERVGITELIAIADDYWSAVNSGQWDKPLFSPDCQRSEFGVYTTNNAYSHDQRPLDYVRVEKRGKSCSWFLDFAPRFRWRVDNRRYYIADEARGVVVALAQFHQFGDGGIPGLTLFEAFKIVNGRVQFLWAPAFTWGAESSGWPDWKRL